MKRKPFNELLRDLRIDSDMRQEDVAKLLGISPGHYGHFEVGVREPTLSTFKQLCSIFHVSSDYFLGLSNDPSVEELYRQFRSLPRTEKDKVIEYTELLHRKYCKKK